MSFLYNIRTLVGKLQQEGVKIKANLENTLGQNQLCSKRYGNGDMINDKGGK